MSESKSSNSFSSKKSEGSDKESAESYSDESKELTGESDFSRIFTYARHGRFGELSEMLEKQTEVDCRDPNGNTIIIIAAQNNHKNIAKLALIFGADIDATNNFGNSALHYCSEYGYTTLGNYLISKGAQPFIKNLYGFMAIQGVRSNKHRKYPFLQGIENLEGRKLS